MFSKLKILLSWILVAGGSFFLILGAREFLAGRLGQNEAADRWNEQETGKPPAAASAQPAEPLQKSIPPGEPIARMLIPRLHTALYVLEGTDNENLRRGPGHMEGTALPGDPGNCIIAGHRDTHFSALKDIRKGDVVDFQTKAGRYAYRVSQISIVSPDNTAPLMPTTDAVLNLITCYPFRYVGSAPRRFIVRADLIDHPVRNASTPRARSRANRRTHLRRVAQVISPARAARYSR